MSSGSELSVLAPVGGLVRARDRVVEHRVPEAVDGVGELGRDRRVDVRVVDVERPDRRLDLAGELLEHQVLVLHLGDEARRLEQPLAVVPAVRALGGRALPLGQAPRRRSAAGVSRRSSTFLMSSTSRSCSEWKIWWIAVSAMFSLTRPSPAQKCAFEHLVVVRAGRLVREVGRGRGVGVRHAERPAAWPGCGRCPAGSGPRCARCRSGTACRSARTFGRDRHRVGEVALDAGPSSGHVLRQPAGRARDELAVRVRGDHRDVRHVRVDEPEAEQVAACFLTDAQVAMPVCRPESRVCRRPQAAQQLAGETGLPAAFSAYSRRNTWCDECDV